MDYGRNMIRKLRKAHGETLDQLAEAVEICKDSLRNYELGKQDIRCSVAVKIAKRYGVTLDRLMCFDGEEER